MVKDSIIKIRKYTKSTLSFSRDDAVIESVFLTVNETTEKWNMPTRNWGIILNQFMAISEDEILKKNTHFLRWCSSIL